MKATALTAFDNSTIANFTAWGWGNGVWPTPTTYGISSFLANAGFTQTSDQGQIVWDTNSAGGITANITSYAGTGSVATYTFTGLAGGYLRAGMLITYLTGIGAAGFDIANPTSSTATYIQSVTYTSGTTGSFTTLNTNASATVGVAANLYITNFTGFLSGTVSGSENVLPPNNSTVGSTSNASYQTLYRSYWSSVTTYAVGDVVHFTTGGSGATYTVTTFVSISAANLNNTPTGGGSDTHWQFYNYEIWQTNDSAQPNFVQATQLVASVAFSPVEYSAPNIVGNTLIAFGRFTGGSGAPTISDTNHNNWIQLITNTNGSDTNVVWVAYGAVAGTNFVTFAQPTQGSIQAIIAEYSGVTSVTPLDQSTSATGSSTAANSGNVTTTVANELILGFVSNSTTNGLTITPGSGFTTRQTVNGNTFLEDKDVTATGTYAATATLSSSVPWFAAIVTLKGTQLPTYYIKLEYGNIGTNCPSIGFQIGTATTGTGALSTSGLRGFREIIGYTSATASPSVSFETDFYADATPGLAGGKFAMIGWRTAPNTGAGTGAQWFLGWERSKDNFGVDTGLYITYVIGLNPSTRWVQSAVFATGGINYAVRSANATQATAASSAAFSLYMQESTFSLQTGNSIPVCPCFPCVGYFGNPLTIILGLNNFDTSEGSTFSAQIYNATHSYIMTGKATGTTWATYFASAGNSGIAMRWE